LWGSAAPLPGIPCPLAQLECEQFGHTGGPAIADPGHGVRNLDQAGAPATYISYPIAVDANAQRTVIP
jgi:hypothetical protein